MGKIYKAYESLCYKSLDWAFEKGKKVEQERLFQQRENFNYVHDYKFNGLEMKINNECKKLKL